MNKLFRNQNKKGLVTDMQLAIIAIVSLLVISIFAYNAYVKFRDNLSVQSCKNSIEAHSLIAKGSFSEIFTDIKCPTKEINIKNLKIANEIIAEDMHRCWYIWNKGEGQYFKGEGNYCHVCSIYSFNDKGQKVYGLMQYLATKTIKVKYPGDKVGVSYQNYFQVYATNDATEKITNTNIQQLAEIDQLDTSQKYATIFVYASGKDAAQVALEGGVRSTVGTVGLFGVVGGSLAVGTGITTAIFIGSNPIGWIVGGVAGVTLGTTALIESLTVKDPEWVSYIAFRPYNAEELKTLQCNQMVVNQMSNSAR